MVSLGRTDPLDPSGQNRSKERFRFHVAGLEEQRDAKIVLSRQGFWMLGSKCAYLGVY
jgi:hypothetical protein